MLYTTYGSPHSHIVTMGCDGLSAIGHSSVCSWCGESYAGSNGPHSQRVQPLPQDPRKPSLSVFQPSCGVILFCVGRLRLARPAGMMIGRKRIGAVAAILVVVPEVAGLLFSPLGIIGERCTGTRNRWTRLHGTEAGLVQRRACISSDEDESLTRSKAIEHVLVGIGVGFASAFSKPEASVALGSDEFEETFQDQAIGIELADVRYKGSSRVLVGRVVPGGVAASRSRIKPDLILVSANGSDLERATATAAKDIIKKSPRPLTLVFRDTSKFSELLKPATKSSSVEDGSIRDASGGFEPISTKIAPEGKGREKQELKLLRSEKSFGCESCQGAKKGDLLEIEYTGKLEDGKVFDGSSIKVNGREVVGRGGDSTIFFVLGKQPKGQFPPGWDLLLKGMCVGESRVISVPPLLGYGEQGLPRRGVPPNASLLYDVKLVGVNGVNMCVS